MKVILSRKGFDYSNGGISSPIMPDGTMLSMPIPSFWDDDKYDDLQYRGESYDKIIHDLKPSFVDLFCHVDPDLDKTRRVKVPKGWKPAFGQSSNALKYLQGTAQIDIGDVFLFFGNFHFVCNDNGKWKYNRKEGDFYHTNDLQVIWGYMQVGNVLLDPDEIRNYYWHPHSKNIPDYPTDNALFVPTKRLSWDDSKPGYGVFDYSKHRVLTAEGMPKATWNKKKIYDEDHIVGNRKNMATDPEEHIYYQGIWQEIMLKESKAAESWAKKIIE